MYAIQHFKKLCIIFLERNILTLSLKVKKILAIFLEICSYCLKLIKLCEKILHFSGRVVLAVNVL